MPVKIWSLPVNYKQLLDCCCPHRAATYFCLESVSELDLPGKFVSLFQLAGPSPRRVKSSKIAAKLLSENFESAKKVKVYDSLSQHALTH